MVGHDVEALDRDLLAVLHRGMEQTLDDAAFNALALRLFAYQYAANMPVPQILPATRANARDRAALAADSGGADWGIQGTDAELYTP